MSTSMETQAGLHSIGGGAALQEHVAVGDWEIQPELNRLQHRHSALYRQLEPRLVQLLCYLAANAHRVLTRDELIHELWPHVVVNENSLTRAISELRKHLAIDASSDRVYIETIPKKGYRLIPPVESVRPASSAVTIPAPAFLPSLNWSHRAAISALCLTLVMVTWLQLSPTLESTANVPTPTLLTDEVVADGRQWLGAKIILSTAETPEFESGAMASPVVSHAGDQYAYIQYGERGSTIYLGNLDEMTEPVAVYSCNTHLYNLAWSPVGNSLLFASKSSVTIPALFSPVQQTADFLMLDLDSLTLRQLIEDDSSIEPASVKPINLT